MAVSSEREKDKAILDEAIGIVMGFLRKKPPEDSHASYLEQFSGVQLKALDRLVPLLERRAMLLGLDATGGTETKPAGQESAVVAAIRGERLRVAK